MTTKTLKLSGGDFSTLTGWVATQLTGTLSAPQQVDFYNFGSSGLIEVGGCSITGFTASNVNRPIINVPSGEGYTGARHTGAWYGTGLTTGAVTPLRYGTDVDYATTVGLEVESIDNTASAYHWNTSCTATNNEFVLQQCMLHAPNAPIGAFAANGKYIFHNNIMFATTAARVIDIRSVTSVQFYCNTCFTNGGDFAFLADSGGSVDVQDTYVGGSSGADFHSAFANNGSYNASSDGTAPTQFPTGSVGSVAGSAVFTSVTVGSENFRLLTGTNALYNTGHTIGAVTVDAFGVARPQDAIYDIGAAERPTAGGAAAPTPGISVFGVTP